MATRTLKNWQNVDLNGLTKIAAEIWALLPNPSLIGLIAEMGAGKTTLVKSLLNQAKVSQFEGSPTFAIVQSYCSPIKGNIYHLDCFRIESQEEVFELGLDELLDESAYFFIEWPQNIGPILPNELFWLYIRSNNDQSREITLCHDY